MLVYLARHAETVANREGVVLGRTDSPLTSAGMAMLERLAARLKGVRLVFCSPLARASATARFLAGKLGSDVIHHDGLMELSCGEWEGKPRREVLFAGDFLRRSWDDAPPGGESCKEAQERVSGVVDRVRSQPGAGPILVVGHSVVNRVFLKVWLELPPQRALCVHQPFDLIYVLDRDGAPRWFDSSGGEGAGLLTGAAPRKAG